MLLDQARVSNPSISHYNLHGSNPQNIAGSVNTSPSDLFSARRCVDCLLLILDHQSSAKSACSPPARIQANRDVASRANNAQAQSNLVRYQLIYSSDSNAHFDARVHFLHISQK